MTSCHFATSAFRSASTWFQSGVQIFTPCMIVCSCLKLLSLAVVLQLVPFLYMFGALLKIAAGDAFVKGRYGRPTLFFAGASGLVTTFAGIALAFFPAQQITSLWSYEVWMVGGTLLFIGMAAFFFFVYGRRKSSRKLEAVAPAS